MKGKDHKKEAYFETVWYSSEEYAKGHVKFIAYEEIGDLFLIQKDGKLEIQFIQNSNLKFTINNIINTYRARQGFTYLLYGFGISLYLLAGSITGISGILYVVFMILLSLPLALLVFFNMRWIVIENEQNGRKNNYYFYDGRYKGYAAWFGGNKKILETIKHMMG